VNNATGGFHVRIFTATTTSATTAAATEEEKVVESRKDPVNFSEPVSDLEAGFFMGAEMAFSARQGLRG